MPPRRNTARTAKTAKAPTPPPLPPLDGLTIAFCGGFPGYTQAGQKKLVEELGGESPKSVTKNATHLIASVDSFKKRSAKVRAALAAGIHIVELQWLEDCAANKTREPEANYLLSSNPAAQSHVISSTSHPSPVSSPPPSPAPSPPAAPPARVSRKRTAATAASQATSPPSSQPPNQPSQPAAKKAKTAAAVPKANAAAKAAPKAKATLDIPVDEHCSLHQVVVYVDDEGVIWDASLNQTNSVANNNKFYRIQVLRDDKDEYWTWTRWGRVGEFGQSAVLGSGALGVAIKMFEKKFKDKSGIKWADRSDPPKPGKYAYIERNYEADDDEDDNDDDDDDADDGTANGKVKNEVARTAPVCTLAKPVQNLMELIFNRQLFAATMADLNYDANKLPLGKLSETTISRGFQALKDLSALFDDPTIALSKYNKPANDAIEELSNMYYSLIPHAFGRNRPPIIQGYPLLKKEIELLESLGDMKDAELLMRADKAKTENVDPVHPADRQYQGLGMKEMTPLDEASTEFKELERYLFETRGSTHRADYKVQDIFRIEREGEHARFDEECIVPEAQRKDARLLWHGSRVTNFGGILNQGLRIAPPEAPVSGYMFGKGIYLADMSSKSANYCCSHSSQNTALLLLCEAELGAPMQTLTDASYTAGEDARAKGMYSTWGQGSTGPTKWKDAGCIHDSLKGVKFPDVSKAPGATKVKDAGLFYNEYIVYDVSQVRLRYLFRVRM